MKLNHRYYFLALVSIVLIIAVVLHHVSNDAHQSEHTNIKIGLAIPLSGASAEDGEAILNGVTLAVDLYNQQNNNLVKLVVEDDKADPKEANSIANKFAADKYIVGVIGHFNSAATLAAIPVLTKAGIAQIAPSGSAPSLTNASPYFRKVTLSDKITGKELANWMLEMGYHNAALLYANNDYGKGLADTVREIYQQHEQGNIVFDQAYQETTSDFGSIIIRLKTYPIDVIILGAMYSDTSAFIKQAHRVGYYPKIAGPTPLLSESLIKLAGNDAEGIMTVGSFSTQLTEPNIQQFTQKYRTRYQKEPSSFSAYAFDAANILLTALNRAGTNRSAINHTLNNFGHYDGITGNATFDQYGDTHKSMKRFIVQDGKFIEWTHDHAANGTN